jgi:hypothetical protein
MSRDDDDKRRSIGPASPDNLNRVLYARFLQSDYPEALRLAELALLEDPLDAIAEGIRSECLAVLARDTVPAPPFSSQVEVEEDEDVLEATLALENRSDGARELYRRFLASEYGPALDLAEELAAEGDRDAMVETIADQCRRALAAPDSIPVLSIPPSSIGEWSNELDPKTAFVLSRIDGSATIEDVADMSGMTVEEVMKLVERFVRIGLLSIEPPRPSH